MKKKVNNIYWGLGLIILATILAYVKIVHFDFVYWDDDKQVLNNVYVKILSWEHIKHNLFYERFTFIPLTLYSIVYQFFADNASVYHIVSIIFHVFNIIFVFQLFKRLRFNDYVVLFTTLLFALHPLRIESVAWISEWKDLIFTFFFLIGMNMYLKWKDEHRSIYIVLYLLMAWLSAFSKVQGLMLPFTIILLDSIIAKKINSKHFIFQLSLFVFILFSLNKHAWYILAIALLLLYLVRKRNYHFTLSLVQKTILGVSILLIVLFIGFYTRHLWFWTGATQASFLDRLVYSGYAMFFYIKQFILPLEQIAIHQYPPIGGAELWLKMGWYLWVWPILILVIFLIYKSKVSLKNWLLFGILFFMLNISMVLHFIPIEGRLIVAERYTYLAYCGLFMVVAILLDLYLNYVWKRITFIVVLLCLSYITYNRTDVWKNTETLFKDVVVKSPTTSFAWINLGSYYLEKNQFNNANNCYRKALQYNPNDVQIYLNQAMANLGLHKVDVSMKNIDWGIARAKTDEDISMFLVTKGQIYAQLGDNERAKILYDSAIAKYNGNFKAWLQKALLYVNDYKMRNLDSAIVFCQKAIQLNNYYADAYHTLGWIYLLKGDIIESEKNIQKAIELDASMPLPYNSLGYIALLKNDVNKAIEYYTQALKMDSSLGEVYKNRAWAYYQNKNFILALSDYNKVLKMTPNDYIANVNKSFCHAYLNDFNQAVLSFKKVIRLYPDSTINLYNLAWAFLQAKQYDSSIIYYEQFNKQRPNYLQALFEQGFAYLSVKKYELALKCFDKVRDQNPANGEVYYWIGIVYEAKGNNDMAKKYFKMAFDKGFKRPPKKM
ncbi:MAG: tetratricopeptide repeat protein [Bacteroidales bacterium]|nr:tetratricopeptide repeat protein [Bacteroidales bacterium]